MKTFDRNLSPINTKKLCHLSGNNLDIFDPSIYTPDNSKFRAEYIERITPKVHSVEVDDSELNQQGTPEVEVNVTGSPLLDFIFKFKNLLGPTGPQGDKAIDKLTLREFQQRLLEGTVSETKWYFVTANNNNLLYIYAGSTLVAKSDHIGNIFPIVFPLTFSN